MKNGSCSYHLKYLIKKIRQSQSNNYCFYNLQFHCKIWFFGITVFKLIFFIYENKETVF